MVTFYITLNYARNISEVLSTKKHNFSLESQAYDIGDILDMVNGYGEVAAELCKALEPSPELRRT